MYCELAVVFLKIRVVLFQLTQCVNYFFNSYNRYHCAYRVKYCPNNMTKVADWLKFAFKPLSQLRCVRICRECDN
jgi:hypothetical protein